MMMMMMMFANIIIIIERQSSPVARGRYKRKITKTKRKEMNALIDVTLKRTHVANEGNAKIATRQIGTQWIRYRCVMTDPVRIFLMDNVTC